MSTGISQFYTVRVELGKLSSISIPPQFLNVRIWTND
jgi:hypothetical protein